MDSEQLIKEGKVDEALAAAKDGVRADPADAKPRIALFQLYCVLGDWSKARDQLKVIKDLTPESVQFAATFAPVLDCEEFRTAVFSGERVPLIFGEPMEWISYLVQALQHVGKGEYQAAEKLRDQAFDLAPASPGTLDGAPMQWIADSDPRMGPVLEVIMDGCYRWVPFCRIESITFEPPKDLRDLVWFPAHFTWTNGGEANGMIPVRYPGTEQSDDPQIRLSRKTEWDEKPGGYFLGRGQRLFTTDTDEKALLDIRECRLETSETETANG